jgi:hypothetical protein
MAECETEHWILDCGAGHSCYLSEFSDNGALGAWGCGSAGTSSRDATGGPVVKGRRKPDKGKSQYFDASAKVELCVGEMPRAELAAALGDLVEGEIVVPDGTDDEQVSLCTTGTVDELLSAVGLSVRR